MENAPSPAQIPVTTPAYCFLGSNQTLSKEITAETPISTKLLQMLVEQLNKVNQDNNLLKENCKTKL